MNIFLVSGRAKAGKDSAALLLQDLLRKERIEAERGQPIQTLSDGIVQLRAFAGPLKKMVCILLGMSAEDMADAEKKEAARPWLVNLGGDVRERDPNAWADAANREIEAIAHQTRNVIITDWRYFNEAWRVIYYFHKWLGKYGPARVHLLRISATIGTRCVRMGGDNYSRYINSGIARDSSESQLDALERSDFKIDPAQLDDVKVLRSVTPIVENNGTREEFEKKIAEWFAFMKQPQYAPVCAEAVMKSCYRLARRLGPEARLMVD